MSIGLEGFQDFQVFFINSELGIHFIYYDTNQSHPSGSEASAKASLESTFFFYNFLAYRLITFTGSRPFFMAFPTKGLFLVFPISTFFSVTVGSACETEGGTFEKLSWGYFD